jgi:hypothetical protein
MTMTMMCGGPAVGGETAVGFAVGRGLAGATGTSVGTGTTGALVGGTGTAAGGAGGAGGAGMASVVAAGVGLGVAAGRLATTCDR